MKSLTVWAAGLALVLLACGGEATPGGDADGPPVTGTGPGISVEEALDHEGDEPVLVNGYLFVDGEGSMTLASAIAESYPPQPGGDRIAVEGLDPSGLELTEDQGVAWTDDPVQVLGTVEDGVLRASDTASG